MKTYTVCPACGAVNGVALEREGRPRCGTCKAHLDALQDGVSALQGRPLATLLAQSPLPVAVDCWAPWCGPCRAFAPTFLHAARTLAGKVAFVKLNTEEDPASGDRYNIHSIPTLLFYKGGHEVDRISGALPYEHLLQWIEHGLRP